MMAIKLFLQLFDFIRKGKFIVGHDFEQFMQAMTGIGEPAGNQAVLFHLVLGNGFRLHVFDAQKDQGIVVLKILR